MKVLAILAVLFAVTQASTPIVRQTPDSSTKNSQEQSAPASKGKHPAPNIASVVPKAETGGTDQTKPNQGKDGDFQTTIIVSEPIAVPVVWHWYEIVAWIANLLLVAFGIRGVFIALSTLRKVERQTKATEDAAEATQKSAESTLRSVKLQEAQLRQWVDIDDWECFFPNTIQNRTNAVKISFWIINPTKLLMTLKTVNIKAGTYGAFALSYPNLLPPSKKYQQDMSINLSDAELDLMRRSNFVITVNVDVSFDDAFGGSPKQHFRVMLRCGALKCDVTEDQRTYDYT